MTKRSGANIEHPTPNIQHPTGRNPGNMDRPARYFLCAIAVFLTVHAAHSAIIEKVEWERDKSRDAWIVAVHVNEPVPAERVRVLMDVDGPDTGGAGIGADWMIEGPHLFRDAGRGAWSWEEVDAVSAIVTPETIRMLIEGVPAEVAMNTVAEITDDQWQTRQRFPENGLLEVKLDDVPRANWQTYAAAQLDDALVMTGGAPFRTAGGKLGFRIDLRGQPDPGRIRIMVNTDGQPTGWSGAGIDVMVEGLLGFRYPEGETDWRWDGQGGVIHAVVSNSVYIVLPFVDVPDTFSWYAETFAPDWVVHYRHPGQGMVTSKGGGLAVSPEILEPPPPVISRLQEHQPESLSRRYQRDYLERNWQPTEEAPVLPRLAVPGAEQPAELILAVTDPASGRTTALTPSAAWTDGSMIRWTGGIEDDATWHLYVTRDGPGRLDVVGAIHADAPACYRVTVGLRYPGADWTWHQDMTTSEPIEPGSAFSFTAASPYGMTQQRSYYPFGVIASPSAVLVAETDGREPRPFIIEADAVHSRLAVHYDLAVTPLTEHFPGIATFHARFRSEPADTRHPFRAAVQDFYRRDPAWKAARVPAHGLWMPFTDIGTIEDAEDFGFAFFEKVGPLGSDVDAAMAQDVLTFPYTEPWLYWLNLPDPSQWNAEAAIERMHELAGAGFGKDRDFASAGLLGASRNPDQEPRIRFMNTPWSTGGRMEVNTDPELPVTDDAPVNRAMAEWRYIESVLADPRVHGIYLDSMSAMETVDYNTNAIRVADYPCTFEPGVLRPGVAMTIQAVEFTAALSGLLKSEGKYLMANFPCWKFPFFMPYIDVPGEETTWYSGNRFVPMDEAELNFRRVVSGQKPFGFLQATHFDTLSRGDMEKYFQLCLYYAFMPSFFSHDGANDPYWVDADLYNRDRPLFLTYVPLIRRLSAAGWQPVPAVACEDPSIAFEQFGRGEDTSWFLTVRNRGADDVTARLMLGDDQRDRTAYDIFSGSLGMAGEDGSITLHLPPEAVTCILVTRPEQISAEVDIIRRWASKARLYGFAARNLHSFMRERESGLIAGIGQEQQGVRGETIEHLLTVSNAGPDAVTVMVPADDADTRVELSPGTGVALPVTRADDAGDGWIHVTWSVQSGEQARRFERYTRPAAVEPVQVSGPDGRVQAKGDSQTLDYRFTSRSKIARILEMTIDGAAPRTVTVPPGGMAEESVSIPRGDGTSRTVPVEVTLDGRTVFTANAVVVFKPPVDHKGRLPGVRVTADSTYSGYTTDALIDGVVDTSGMAWNEAAFATAESTDPHWVRMSFPVPQTIHQVTAHWNREGGVLYASQQGEAWGLLPDETWARLGAMAGRENNASSTIAFDPVLVRAVEWRQPPSGGAAARPDLIWLVELEVQ